MHPPTTTVSPAAEATSAYASEIVVRSRGETDSGAALGRPMVRGTTVRARTVLLCEDDLDDIDLFCHALGTARIENTLHIAYDGEAAVNYLSGDGKYADCERYPVPHLLFLDLKMPLVSGFDVLRWMRAHREFDQTCVVVLSSSAREEDVREAYALGANGYFQKPPRRADLHAVLNLVAHNTESWVGLRLGHFGVGH